MKITPKKLLELGAVSTETKGVYYLHIGAMDYRIQDSGDLWEFGRAYNIDDTNGMWDYEAKIETVEQLIFQVFQIGLEIGAENKRIEICQSLGIR
jgi:hypothetical protein